MIRARSLSKRFGGRRVLNDLDLDIATGRVTAIVGPNGSGKSTLIRIILGLVRPDGGTIHVGGTAVNGDPAYRSRIGYMPQMPRFPENLTAREVLGLLTELRGNPVQRDVELIERFGLETEMDKRLGTLSTGNRQKVNAAMAFLFSPELLILDEPTAGLDPVAAGIFKDKIRSLREVDRTIVFTTHIMSEVAELADDVAFVLDGRIRFVTSPGQIMSATQQATFERGIAQLMREAAA